MNVSILNLIFNEILECRVSILLKYMAEIAQHESNKAFNGSNLQCYFSAIWVKSTLLSPKQCKGSLRGRSAQGQQSRNVISNQPWGCCCSCCRGKGVAAEWESPRFPPDPLCGGCCAFPLGYKLFNNMSITYGSSNNVGKAHCEWVLHSQPLQQGWAGSIQSLMPPGPSLPQEPQWFSTSLSPAQQNSSPCTLWQFSQKLNHILFFRRKHMLRGKTIKMEIGSKCGLCCFGLTLR